MKLISTLPLLYNTHKIFVLINDFKSCSYLFIRCAKNTFILATNTDFQFSVSFELQKQRTFCLVQMCSGGYTPILPENLMKIEK